MMPTEITAYTQIIGGKLFSTENAELLLTYNTSRDVVRVLKSIAHPDYWMVVLDQDDALIRGDVFGFTNINDNCGMMVFDSELSIYEWAEKWLPAEQILELFPHRVDVGATNEKDEMFIVFDPENETYCIPNYRRKLSNQKRRR